MFSKLKLAYVTVFYKLCILITSWVKRIMLHLINFQGIDPSRDVAAEQHKALIAELSNSFDENSKREVSKISVNIGCKYGVKHKAFKIKHLWPQNVIVDYSNVEDVPWLPEPLQVVKAPEVVVPVETVVDVIPEVAEEDILEVITIVEEVAKPIKKRKSRVVVPAKKATKKLVKKPVKKVVKKSKKK